jgi:hypothetical protein
MTPEALEARDRGYEVDVPHVCHPQDSNWPCSTVLEARAALGEQSTGPTLEGRTDDAG